MGARQTLALLAAIACMVALGNYASAVKLRNEVGKEACTTVTRVLTTFLIQEKEAGASARRLRAYTEALQLVSKC